MNMPRPIVFLACAGLPLLAACDRRNEPTPTARDSNTSIRSRDQTRPTPAPDNTAKNKGDASKDAKTPMDQSQSSEDVKLTAEIRRAIMSDSAMSTNAQNCKIITDKTGLVTLRGVVSSQAEKDSIEAKAKAVVGVARVDNQLEVKIN